MFKHPTAVIEPGAVILEGVHIGAFCMVGSEVEIGAGCRLESHVVISGRTKIGENNHIFPFASLGHQPQDLKFKGEYTTAEIGDNTVIRECVTINRGTSDRNKTLVGNNCLLMAYVHVAHDCFLGDNVILSNGVQLAGHITLGDFVIIGGTSAVHQFVNIGAHSMIAGGSLVRKDVPPFVKAAREPLSYSGVNSIGLRRRNFTSEKIEEIQEI